MQSLRRQENRRHDWSNRFQSPASNAALTPFDRSPGRSAGGEKGTQSLRILRSLLWRNRGDHEGPRHGYAWPLCGRHSWKGSDDGPDSMVSGSNGVRRGLGLRVGLRRLGLRGCGVEEVAAGGVELGAPAEEQDLIADEQFLIGTGVHEVGARAFDGDDAGAGLGAQSELAD